MRKIEIDVYAHYRHNAYDSYECSWGVLMGLGGDGNAFTEDEKICGDTCDCRTKMGNALENFEEKLDVEIMLQNLDSCMADIQEGLNDGGEYIHNEYDRGENLPVKFLRVDSDIHAIIDIGDKHHEFIVTNLV